MTCIICDAIILTGKAMVVLEGDVNGSGQFTAKDVVGGLCAHCGDPESIKGIKFPFTFPV